MILLSSFLLGLLTKQALTFDFLNGLSDSKLFCKEKRMLERRSIKKHLFSPTRSHTSKERSKPWPKRLNRIFECWTRRLPFVPQWLCVCNARHMRVQARTHTRADAPPNAMVCRQLWAFAGRKDEECKPPRLFFPTGCPEHPKSPQSDAFPSCLRCPMQKNREWFKTGLSHFCCCTHFGIDLPIPPDLISSFRKWGDLIKNKNASTLLGLLLFSRSVVSDSLWARGL